MESGIPSNTLRGYADQNLIPHSCLENGAYQFNANDIVDLRFRLEEKNVTEPSPEQIEKLLKEYGE